MTDTPQAHPVTGSGLPTGETFYPVPYFFDVMDMPVTPKQACKSEPVTVPIRLGGHSSTRWFVAAEELLGGRYETSRRACRA